MKKKDDKEIKKKKKFIEFIVEKPTKKELEIQKKIKKLSKFTKVLCILLIICIVSFFINNTIMYFYEDYAYFYISNVTNFKNGLFFWLFSFIPYSNFLIPLVTIVSLLATAIMTDMKKLDIKKRNFGFNANICIFILFIYFFAFSIFTEAQYRYHLPNLDKTLFEEAKDKVYTSDELVEMNNYLKNKIIEYAHNLDRNKNGDVVLDGDYNKIASNDLNNVSDKLSLLRGLYPTKSTHLNEFFKGFYGSSTVGLTNMYATYLDYNASSVSALNTITHEYCHTKGFIKENETVFCSFLAGVNSDNLISNYAAYLEAFSRSNYALGYIDLDAADDIEYDVLRMCLTDNYSEFCELYIKNNNGYIPGVEQLRLSTYRLSDYKDYYNEFINSLSILNENDAVFVLDGNEITYDEIISLLNNGSDSSLFIKLDLNSKVYKKIENAISNDRLFVSIYQKDLDEKEPPDIEDPHKFFLSPFEDDDKYFNKLNFSYEDYTYERATRLFLQYFDKYGYK